MDEPTLETKMTELVELGRRLGIDWESRLRGSLGRAAFEETKERVESRISEVKKEIETAMADAYEWATK